MIATKDELILDLVKTNRQTPGETMTAQTYREEGKYSVQMCRSKFDTWNNARKAAGIYRER